MHWWFVRRQKIDTQVPHAALDAQISRVYIYILVISTLARSQILWPIIPSLPSMSVSDGGNNVMRAYVPAPRRLDK